MTQQVLPGGYYFDAGLFPENREQPISNFYMVPSTVYRLSGDTLPRFADIEIVRSGGTIPLSQRIALAQLTSQWWKKPPPGCVYYPGVRGAARHLQTVFQLLLGQLEAVEVFQPTKLGWTQLPSGDPVYITGSGAIGAEGFLPSDRVWIPESLKEYQLEQVSEASLDSAPDYFWGLFGAIPGTTGILVANALSAILFPIFQAAGVNSCFPLILEGPSEIQKTTLACLTSSLYNRRSSSRGNIVTLNSTKRALEQRGADIRHATIVFDDLFPDGRSALERKAMDLIRDIANQLPREARSGKTLTGIAMECGAVITAEYFRIAASLQERDACAWFCLIPFPAAC